MGFKKHKHLNHYFTTVKGISLLELMVGVVLSSIVALTLYEFLIIQNRTYSKQDNVAEMEQNLRSAAEKIKRDLTMAGYGKPNSANWTNINGTTWSGFTVQATGGNTLDIVGCLDKSEGNLQNAVSRAATSITLQSGQGANFNTTTKRDIFIGGRENARITAKSTNTLTVDTSPANTGTQGLYYGFAAGTEICTVKWVTYAVNTSVAEHQVLTLDARDGSGAQAVAENITGMAVSISGNVVNVILTGRSRNKDNTTNQYETGQISFKIKLRNG